MSLKHYSTILTRASFFAIPATASSLYFTDHFSIDAPFVRSFRFWSQIIPIYAHYRFVEWKISNISDPHLITEAYKPLNHTYAPIIRRLTLQLQGFYYKLAQILSTRDDFLPNEYLHWAKQLQDQSPTLMSSTRAQAIVRNSLQVPFQSFFSEWHPEPIGAASIAQVHRARLASNNQLVAVKIQFPSIERKFRADLRTVELFCKYFMPQNTAYFAEIKKQFVTEFDATAEARNLQLVHDNIHKAGWNKHVYVPQPIISSKQVLVMTYVEGPKLITGVKQHFKRLAERQGKDFDEVEAEQKRLIESGENERKSLEKSDRQISLLHTMLRLYDMLINSVVFVGNYTVRPFIRSEKWSYHYSERPLNLAHVMGVLLRVHAHEIFTDGAFNGDPHPGNVLLMPDGRLGLIDYGQVKKMTVEDRIIYAKLIIAISRDDREEVVRIMTDEVGFRTKNMNPDIIYRTAVFFNCRDSDDITLGMNVSKFMDWLEHSDPVRKINDEFVMVGRVSVLLRGMANAFGLKVRVSDYWKEEAQVFLRSQRIDY